MREISLLNGLGQQHPDSAHYMRPDRVYRTSVLSPMTGYNPGQAVQAVAYDFTMGPYSGMSLSGLRGTGLFPRVRAWWAGVKARMAARRMMMLPAAQQQVQSTVATTASEKQVHSPGNALPPQAHGHAWGHYKHGYQTAPMFQTAAVVGPISRGLPQDYVAAAYHQSPAFPAFAEDAAYKTTMMRWRGLRFPWG